MLCIRTHTVVVVLPPRGIPQIREFSEKLEKYGISIASNQVEYSLVNQDADEDGTLAECNRLGERESRQETRHHSSWNWLSILVHNPTDFIYT